MSETVLPDRPVLTVTDVLGMASVQQGQPHVLTGETGLSAPVRWVHIAAGSGIAGLLAGGELILTTGAGWPRDTGSLLAEINDLIQSGISGLFIEHGSRFTSIPEQVVELCRMRGVALVELTRETSFVRVTEQVHRRILEEQSEALAARDEVQQMLTKLGLNRAPVDYVVEQLAGVLNSTVVLENTVGEVISWASAHAGGNAQESLELWPRNVAKPLPEGAESVAVQAREARWGQLVALPGASHPAGLRTVLELGAVAIALGRLADPQQRFDWWASTNAKDLLDSMLEGRYRSDQDVAAELTARGVQFEGNEVRAFTLDGADADTFDRLLDALRQSLPESARILSHRPTAATPRVLGILTVPAGRHAAGSISPDFGSRLHAAVTENIQHPAVRLPITLTFAPAIAAVSEVAAAIEQAAHGLRTASAVFESDRVRVLEIAEHPLTLFVSSLTNDERLNRFSHHMLKPLLEYDLRHNGDLVHVLDAYVHNPTNRSRAAAAASLSRSVFYQRIELIEQLLDVDLTDGTTIAALVLALEAAPHLHSTA